MSQIVLTGDELSALTRHLRRVSRATERRDAYHEALDAAGGDEADKDADVASAAQDLHEAEDAERQSPYVPPASWKGTPHFHNICVCVDITTSAHGGVLSDTQLHAVVLAYFKKQAEVTPAEVVA